MEASNAKVEQRGREEIVGPHGLCTPNERGNRMVQSVRNGT